MIPSNPLATFVFFCGSFENHGKLKESEKALAVALVNGFQSQLLKFVRGTKKVRQRAVLAELLHRTPRDVSYRFARPGGLSDVFSGALYKPGMPPNWTPDSYDRGCTATMAEIRVLQAAFYAEMASSGVNLTPIAAPSFPFAAGY